MSFSRHGEIYRPMGASKQSGEPAELGSPAHRYDESPAGYSSAGWSPPEPASASPAAIRMRYSDPAGRDFCSERRTVSYSVVSAEGSTPCQALAFVVKHPNVKLCYCIALLCRLSIPGRCLRVVLRNALAVAVEQAEVIFCTGITLIGRLAKPKSGLRVVPRHAIAFCVCKSNRSLRGRITSICLGQ